MGTKLFRLTTKRRIILNNIVSTIRNKIEHLEGFDARIIASIEDNEKKEIEQQKAKLETNKMKLSSDVLETVFLHNSKYLMDFYEDRDWENELQVPLELFREGIQNAIGLLEHYKNSPYCRNDIKKYEEQIDLLNSTIRHREEQEIIMNGDK